MKIPLIHTATFLSVCIGMIGGTAAAGDSTLRDAAHQTSARAETPDVRPPAQSSNIDVTAPTRRPDGKKWRLGYVYSGDDEEYARTLLGLVQGLAQLDWLSLPENTPTELGSKQLWDFLSDSISSDYLEFVRNARWQADNSALERRAVLRQSIKDRLSTAKDIDLIIAMGTWAGQDIVAIRAPVPTVVAATSDPVGAHIIRSPGDSGLDNLYARVDPERYQRQVRLFHDVIPFKRLGLVYEDTDDGKTFGALDATRQVSRERGFAILTCTAPATGVSQAEATRNVLDCYRRLAPDIDAAYVTVHRGITGDSIKSLAQILRDARIPSFSMLGASEVQQGILLSLAQADASHIGMTYAEIISRILNGATARELDQITEESAKLAINLYTARLIGFDPPVDTLLAADEIIEE